MMALLHDEAQLEEIVKPSAWTPFQIRQVEDGGARSIRRISCTSSPSTKWIPIPVYESSPDDKAILAYYDLQAGGLPRATEKLALLPVRERIGRLKYCKEQETEQEYPARLSSCATR